MMRRLNFVDEDVQEEDEMEFYLPRVSFEADRPLRLRRSLGRRSISLTSPLSLMNLRQSFHYDQLPQVPIHLTIVKLDGSFFAAEVQKTATVSQLKQAVEMTFSHMPMKGPGKISWRHVWGHFCLSYYGQKLVEDDEFLKDYGIKDGDELHFVRHVSISYNLIKKRSKERIEVPEASRIPHVLEEIKREAEEDDCDHLENLKCQRCLNDYQSPIMHRDSTFAHFFRGWLFHSRLGRTEKSGPKVMAYPPSLADGLVGCFRSIFQFCNNKPSCPSRVSKIEI